MKDATPVRTTHLRSWFVFPKTQNRAPAAAADPTDKRAALSPIDASPLVLKVLNSPSLLFSYALNIQRLQAALVELMDEYPIIAGRLHRLPPAHLKQHPHLRSAPYCINTTVGAVLLCEARINCATADVDLSKPLSAPFSALASEVDLPAWYQPVNMKALFKGQEPVLKLQVTHTTDGGYILAATMPHIVADGHSTTLLLARLAQLYQQIPNGSTTATPTVPGSATPGSPTNTAGEAAAAVTSAYAAMSSNGTAADSDRVTDDQGPDDPAATLLVACKQQDTSDAPQQACNGSKMMAPGLLSRSAAAARGGKGHIAVGDSPQLLRQPPAAADKPTSSNAWSKALLLATQDSPVTDIADTQTLKALSLDLQSVDKPTLTSTFSWLFAAIREGTAATRRFPNTLTALTSVMLHIPQQDVQQALKATAAAGPYGKASQQVSTNAAVTALVWVLYAAVRGRELPGAALQPANSNPAATDRQQIASTSRISSCSNSSGSAKAWQGLKGLLSGGKDSALGRPRTPRTPASSNGGVVGVAIDIRHNCPDLQQQLPPSYFGNAAWCLHISSERLKNSNSPIDGAISSGRDPSKKSGSDVEQSVTSGVAASTKPSNSSNNSIYSAALQAAAAAVGEAVMSFRQEPGVGDTLLQLIMAQSKASTATVARNLARLAVKVDAFVTSWQFPAYQVNFGQGPPLDYSCVVRPTPPWQAAVLPSKADDGDMRLLLTIPVSAVDKLRHSPVLQQLVPHAQLLH